MQASEKFILLLILVIENRLNELCDESIRPDKIVPFNGGARQRWY